ncbi:MAG: enoyl-CoA hydratase-related protein [Candidatus Pelagadaptatus aseana]|uniref:enoyl-CoA hydratase/isomerase family protein n=1 Tax=Candidatus Pelagadaptatus aseana TaxID=3120508 RepID=UPI0039B21FD5
MSTLKLELKDGVHVLTLTDGANENKLTQEVVEDYIAKLDEIASFEGNTALMITCEHEKTFSTGINLEWMMAQTPEGVQHFVKTLEKAMFKLAMLNMPTVVAINGNCYAGGAILMTGCDFRFMRADRGRFCYPEVNIQIPFTPLMQDLVDVLPNKQVLKEMCLLGRALTGAECLEANVVDGLFSLEELQEKTFEFAKMLAQKDRNTYSIIKQQMRPNIEKHREAIFA